MPDHNIEIVQNSFIVKLYVIEQEVETKVIEMVIERICLAEGIMKSKGLSRIEDFIFQTLYLSMQSKKFGLSLKLF
jgi:hypothetical protein